MEAIGEYGQAATTTQLNKAQKAAAILIAMGKPIAGKLLKYFASSELQLIIANAQTLRSVPADELEVLVNEFEDLFTEGAGLMDNAKAMEGILEEGLPPDEVDGLLGRRTPFQAYEASVWDRLQSAEPEIIGNFLASEHPQTVAYIVSMLPPAFAAKTLFQLPEAKRADIVHRTVNMKQVNPKIAEIIHKRVVDLVESLEAEKNSAGTNKVADMMNELAKPQVDALLGALNSISSKDVERVRPKIFLFEDILEMPAASRVTLFDDISNDIITASLRGVGSDMRECVLSSIGARQRRMIETDLSAAGGSARDSEIARRSITQEAIRLAAADRIVLKERRETLEAA
ncbi:flagellar motor switch protein FliG [Pararhizobium haloflavum]|uniref:flagellar motor switch protein FliG n=1 Tax=Pararhizobium haloflavum TaxID=2037914 RepID=UPI000C191BCF|nr:flagellar motor switch protein FliG [Pararhizobium haloflavum]